MELTVKIRNNYGAQVIYPTCEVGEAFCRIAGTKTLTDQTRLIMKQLGYSFVAKQQEVTL
jgi:hypothetical protein